MIMTIVTVSTSSINALVHAYRENEKLLDPCLKLNLFYAARNMSALKLKQMEIAIRECDLVIVDLMGSPEPVIKRVEEALEKTEADVIPYGRNCRAFMKLGSFSAASMKSGEKKPDMKAMKKMAGMAEKMGKLMPGKMRDMGNYSMAMKYFSMANESNMRNMLFLLLREYGGAADLPKPEKPMEIPVIGLCHPITKQYGKGAEEMAGHYGYQADRQTVAVLFYGHTYPNDTSKCVHEFCRRISEFANVLPIAFSSPSPDDFSELERILVQQKDVSIDAVVNFMAFRLSAGPMGGNAEKAVTILKELNVPYFHPFFMSRRREQEWMESKQGVSTSEFTISVMMSEFDGAVETMPIAAMTEPKLDQRFDVELRELTLIEERVRKCIGRIRAYLNMRRKSNAEKKIAVIGYNYPPGEANVFGGAFLDTFKSMEKLLIDLKGEGYDTEVMSSEALIKLFTSEGMVNSGRYTDRKDMIHYSLADYINHFWDHELMKEVCEQWGPAPGGIMSISNGFKIPGIQLGNVFIGLQPSRGIHEQADKVYHDKSLLPHHQYLAFYQWIEHGFQADAMIHVGTHGTLEFQRGKECGMSGKCLPDQLVGQVPHLYLYYASNPSEAMIAKRRSHAQLIGYQPTAFVPGELYGDYATLNALIDEYREAKQKAPTRCEGLLQEIQSLAVECDLPQEIDDIEHELYRMHQSLIPDGLHTFGVGYSQGEAVNYAMELLMQDHGDVESLPRLLCRKQGLDYEALYGQGPVETRLAIREQAKEIFMSYMMNGELADPSLQATLRYGEALAEKCRINRETAGLINTLNGAYNPAKLAGDIYRSPEVMPTGYNLYQFDPRKVPSQTAQKRGWTIAENTLKAYWKDHQAYPSSTALVLWGLETSRTEGETIGQILAFWGVRAKRSSYQWEAKYEIIPLEELGRPRIDVTINICGFFRDMFPNLLQDLNRLLAELASLDEPEEMNFIKRNSRLHLKTLLEEQVGLEEAAELSVARIFGPPEGEYGTGITSLIETKNWSDEATFGEAFKARMQHVYSANFRGRSEPALYENHLRQVAFISQIRSNHEYEVTDLDHYYEFFGGLSKSVEGIRGEKAPVYITDTTMAQVETKTLAQAINRGIRTRLLNPKWIDGLLEHDYHGGQVIADRFENVMGLMATTGQVEPWVFDAMHEKYVSDREMADRMRENNPFAYIEIIEQMLEYKQRGYWDATEEQLDQLRAVYLETEGCAEEETNII